VDAPAPIFWRRSSIIMSPLRSSQSVMCHSGGLSDSRSGHDVVVLIHNCIQFNCYACRKSFLNTAVALDG
jgi:hypothetical protein